MRRELRYETVRQRSNEVPGYKSSCERVDGYCGKLMVTRQRTGIFPENLDIHLDALRREHIVKTTLLSEPGVPQALTVSSAQAAPSGEML